MQRSLSSHSFPLQRMCFGTNCDATCCSWICLKRFSSEHCLAQLLPSRCLTGRATQFRVFGHVSCQRCGLRGLMSLPVGCKCSHLLGHACRCVRLSCRLTLTQCLSPQPTASLTVTPQFRFCVFLPRCKDSPWALESSTALRLSERLKSSKSQFYTGLPSPRQPFENEASRGWPKSCLSIAWLGSKQSQVLEGRQAWQPDLQRPDEFAHVSWRRV